jgi:hypothetical protein
MVFTNIGINHEHFVKVTRGEIINQYARNCTNISRGWRIRQPRKLGADHRIIAQKPISPFAPHCDHFDLNPTLTTLTHVLCGATDDVGVETTGQTAIRRHQQDAHTLDGRARLDQVAQSIFHTGQPRNIRKHLAGGLGIGARGQYLLLCLTHFGSRNCLHCLCDL